MFQETIDYFRNYAEKYRINKEIKALLWAAYDRSYRTMEEANENIERIIGLIDKAKEFNKRTSTRPLDIDRFTQRVCFLEQRIEDDYFSGLLPVK